MSNLRYYTYDHDACTFVEVKPSRKKHITQLGAAFSLALVLGLLIAWAASTRFGTPEELALREENRVLQNHLEQATRHMATMSLQLDALAETDRELYSTILGKEPVSNDVRQMGVGGVDLYEEYRRYSPDTRTLLRQTSENLGQLDRQMQFQSDRYRELMDAAESRKERLTQLPSIMPTEGRLVSGFGMRNHPILKVRRMHPGIDIVVPTGTEIVATGDGVVKRAGVFGTYGKLVEIVHPTSGHITRYAHLSEPKVRKGQKVKRGEVVGLSGNTGLSAAPHLHYEVRNAQGELLDPIGFLAPSMTPQEFAELRAQAEAAVFPMDVGIEEMEMAEEEGN